jgi:hypothetical protein
VIGDREPFPIGHERVFRSAQHCADVMRVMIGRIKIGVIADRSRQLHRDIFLRVKNTTSKRGVIPQRRCFGGEQILDDFSRLSPSRPAESEKRVESAFPEDAPALKLRRTEVAGFFQK